MLHVFSAVVLALIALAVVFRKTARAHISLVALAFLIDLGLVLWIELDRSVIEELPEEKSALLWTHIGISTLVVVCYFVLLSLGLKLLKGDESRRPKHRLWAIIFIALRLTNFGTALFINA